MRRYKLSAMCLLATALLVGCGSTVEAPDEQLSAEPTQEAPAQVTITEESAPQAADTATPAPTETPAGQVQEIASQEPEATKAVATEPAPTPEPPTATAAPQINGRYEETYYRGLATAPITMIDYSDFL